MKSGKSWLQFSIRKLFAFVALVALVVWWITLPSRNVARFVRAINEGNLDVAAAMFVDSTENLMLTEWQPLIGATASVESPTLDQLFYGRRRITIIVTYQGVGKPITSYFPLEASRKGIHASHNQ